MVGEEKLVGIRPQWMSRVAPRWTRLSTKLACRQSNKWSNITVAGESKLRVSRVSSSELSCERVLKCSLQKDHHAFVDNLFGHGQVMLLLSKSQPYNSWLRVFDLYSQLNDSDDNAGKPWERCAL